MGDTAVVMVGLVAVVAMGEAVAMVVAMASLVVVR